MPGPLGHVDAAVGQLAQPPVPVLQPVRPAPAQLLIIPPVRGPVVVEQAPAGDRDDSHVIYYARARSASARRMPSSKVILGRQNWLSAKAFPTRYRTPDGAAGAYSNSGA